MKRIWMAIDWDIRTRTPGDPAAEGDPVAVAKAMKDAEEMHKAFDEYGEESRKAFDNLFKQFSRLVERLGRFGRQVEK